MNGLTCLSTGGQVSASNNKQPTLLHVLAIRHISILARAASAALAASRISAHADDRRKAEPYCRDPLGGYGFALSPLSLDRQRWLMGLFLSLPDF